MNKILLFTFLTLWAPTYLKAQQNYSDSIVSGGFTRTFRMYIPKSYDSGKPLPLVFNFHGNTQTALSFEEKIKYREIADTAGFILITPDGLIDPRSPKSGQGWNVFSCCATQNDVLFVSDLIDYSIKKLNIDTTRIYASGFSIGGFFVYDLACNLSNRIAAFASVSGSMELQRIKTYKPSISVPIVEFHGTKDRLVAYDGGESEGIVFAAIDTLLNFWIRVNQCASESITINLDDKNQTDGSTVQHIIFQNCKGNSTVELYKIIDGGHRWPGIEAPNSNKDILAEQEIWSFFRKHKLK
ncbi:MAG: PHB depolymerase family esterase [Bacteroidota bacterium]|nr:PHB depolymerase family esterase [Bacteroidota bacterium]